MTPAPRIGSQFASYRIESILGRGGMSVVYRAENVELGNKIALKVLAESLEEDDVFRERFVRESRLAASINNAHVLPIYTAGSHEDILYIAMKYVAGWDLRTVLLERGPLDPDTAVSITAQAGRALDAAHARDLVHRDVKPANILIERHGECELGHVYLADFGLMKHTLSHSGVTRTGGFLGTVAYVAPEQITRGDVDGRGDIYSLGCVLYEAMTGHVPFERATEWAVLQAHITDMPLPPSAHRPGIPKELDAVVLRAMAKSPDDRFRTCDQLSVAARSALGTGRPPTGSGEKSATEPPSTTPVSSVVRTPPRPTADAGHGPRRFPGLFRWRTLAVVLMITALASAGIYAIVQRSGASNSSGARPRMGLGGIAEAILGQATCTNSMNQVSCTHLPTQTPTARLHDVKATSVTLTAYPRSFDLTNLGFASALHKARQADPDLRPIGASGRGTGSCGPDSKRWDHEDYWYHMPEHQNLTSTDDSGQSDGDVFCYTDKNGQSVFVWTQCSLGIAQCIGPNPRGIPFLGTIVAPTKRDAFGYYFYVHHNIGMTV